MNSSELANINFTTVRMINRIVHDSRTNLSCIRAFQGMLTEGLPKLIEGYKAAVKHQLVPDSIDEGDLHIIQDIPDGNNKALNGASDFLDTLLTFGKALKEPHLDAKSFSVKEALTQIMARYPFKTEAQKKSVTISIKQDFNCKLSSFFFEHLINHLLDNAFHNMDETGTTRISIETEVNSNEQLIRFNNTSKRINEEKLPTIFDRFFSRRDEKTIPGLGFCRLAVLEAGGDMTCSSQGKAGAEFLIRFH